MEFFDTPSARLDERYSDQNTRTSFRTLNEEEPSILTACIATPLHDIDDVKFLPCFLPIYLHWKRRHGWTDGQRLTLATQFLYVWHFISYG